jgi:repressor of nif and glnA expression
MKDKGNILNNFILNTLKEENSLNIQFITNQDISKLVKLIESTSVEQLNISPSVQDIKETSDLFIVLEDIELKESEIGIIKNLLSQKIVIFSIPRDGVKESNMIKLGFQVELEDSKNKILCFSYNLKTYNNKRSWNNAEGWANPENFDKYRW